MAQLNQFNGGINTRVASHLLSINEAVKYKNIDNAKISLGPIKDSTDEGISLNRFFINFNDTWVSSNTYKTYLEFQEKLYYSDGIGKPQKSIDSIEWYNLGIEKPTALDVEVLDGPNLIITEPEVKTVGNITAADLSAVDGGNLPGDTVFNYKLVNSAFGVTSISYEFTASLTTNPSNATIHTITIDNFIIDSGTVYNIILYREYMGVYRYVDNTTNNSMLYDATYDISSNTAYAEGTEFPLGETMYYCYEAYNSINGIRVQKYNYVNLPTDKKTYEIILNSTSSNGTISNYRKYLGTYRKVIAGFDSVYDISGNQSKEKEKSISGTYQYCYTYYNSTDGTESQPVKYSEDYVANESGIKVTVYPSDDLQVDTIRLYRIGGNLVSMSLVTELPNEQAVYTDITPDLDIDGHILDTLNNAPAPIGLNYLTESNAMFFGSVKDKLYYSDVAYVNYWSSFNFIDFDDTITGIGPTANGLLVFTKYKTYIVTGTSPSTLSKYLVSSNQGCLDHRSISFAKNTLLWASTDGICASSGGDIIVVSRDKLGKISLMDIRDAIVFDDVYYIAYGNNILALDTRFGNILREITQEIDSFSIYNDTLYYTLNGQLYSLFTDVINMIMEYKSPKLSDGQISNLKNYKSIYVRCIGNLQVKIYIDDILVITKDIDSKTPEILIPQQARKGYYIQFEVTGDGELLELQYIVEGRQNGR